MGQRGARNDAEATHHWLIHAFRQPLYVLGQEIGERMAPGAARRDTLGLVLRHGITRICYGIVLGVIAAVGVSRVLSSVLVNTSTTDPTTFVSICLLLAAVTLLACFVPARRATRLDPVDALRPE
jgi:ABC-type antimicrobial peptide transport system permease subunit